LIPKPSLTYVVPVHNAAAVLEGAMERLVHGLPGQTIELLLVENGSSDDSAMVCGQLAQRAWPDGVSVRALQSPKGMGHAYRTGMKVAQGHLWVLTAADLPFGVSDLNALRALDPTPRVAVGSKAHPQSRNGSATGRRALSAGFRLLRGLLIGLWVGDSQGTILIEAGLGAELLPHLRCHDYLISAEILAWAQRFSVAPVEVPVDYPGGQTRSTVRPVRDSAAMAVGLWQLRGRLRAAPRPTERGRVNRPG
jgi:dolichyl-phosphate beta-glucosyltransferase